MNNSWSYIKLTMVVAAMLQLFVSSPTMAQDYDGFGKSNTESDTISGSKIKGPLDFKGHVEELTKKLKGAIVTLSESPDGSHEGLVEIRKMVTPGSGQFEFKLEINKFYVLSVEKGGYTTKTIDIDTDVRMARPQHTKVPEFGFRVDMVKDLDGLAFKGSVASVFYHIKKNEFDYELDYSKEEMEEEERLIREQEEKRRLAELAAKKKFEIEEAAKLLLEKDNATAQEIIVAAIKVGDGDPKKIKSGFEQVFSEVDSLRSKKAEVMYDQLLEERKRSEAKGQPIDYQAIFGAAQTYEEDLEKSITKEQQKKVEELRVVKEEAKRKEEMAMAVQQKALELEMNEKMAAAVKAEEIRKAKEEKEEQDKIYYAIFESNGNSEVAIQNLIKSYPKGDPYREQKAKAIYAEYEKARLGGTKLSNIDYKGLFRAADQAEQEAIKQDIDSDIAKGNDKLQAFMQKVEERKQKEQQQIVTKIESGLPEAPKDRASQISVFENALAKNDPYKEEKAKAMYQEYVQQKQKMGGSGTFEVDYSALFKAADEAEANAKITAKEELVMEKRKAQEQLEAQREEIRKQKAAVAQKADEEARKVHKVQLADAKNKKELQLAEAIENGQGDRDNTIQQIAKTLPATGDKELDQLRAEAVYDSYLEESKKIKQSGSTSAKIDFGALFKAADNAELARLERQFQAKQAEEQERLAVYSEQRIEKAKEIAQVMEREAEKDLELADKKYESTLLKVEAERQERIAKQKQEEEALAKELAMEQAKREAYEQGVKAEELAAMQKERDERLAKEKREAEEKAAKEEAERRKQEQLAKEAADKQLALAEKAQREAEESARKAEAARKLEEEKRLAAEAKAQRDAELAAEKAEQQRLKEEEERLAAEAKAQRDAELAAEKAEQQRLKEEEERLAAEAKAKRDAELAAEKAELQRQKEEEERLAAEAKAKRDAELAAEKAEQQRLKEEEERLAAEAKAKRDAELAAEKAEQQRLKEEEERLAAEAKAKAEEKARKIKEEFDRLVYLGDQAMAKKAIRDAWEKYNEAKLIDPSDKDVARKFSEADSELKRIEKAEADRLALDAKYSKLLSEGDAAFAENEYDDAKKKYQEASDLKPDEKAPSQKIKEVDKVLARLAQEQKELQAQERKYILLMQDGAKALEAGKLDDARSKYEEALSLKPDETEPKNKLAEVEELEAQLALAEQEKRKREAEAKEKFAQQQKQEEERKRKEAELKQKEEAARIAALGDLERDKSSQLSSAAKEEEERIRKYEELRATIEKMDLKAEAQRLAFLSELAKIYPEGLTKERVDGKNFVLLRHVINKNSVVTIYEKKTWDWGGVFYFKDSDVAITQAIYELEIGKYGE